MRQNAFLAAVLLGVVCAAGSAGLVHSQTENTTLPNAGHVKRGTIQGGTLQSGCPWVNALDNCL